jgi:CHAT domain-containing protein
MRALIYAGTPSVLMSLWAVDEISSGILMKRFYAALASGQTKAEALQAAQLAVQAITAAAAITFCEQAIRRLEQACETRTVRPIRCRRFRPWSTAFKTCSRPARRHGETPPGNRPTREHPQRRRVPPRRWTLRESSRPRGC